MNKENTINDALELVQEFEQSTKQYVLQTVTIFILCSFILSIYAYGHLKAIELEKISTEITKSYKNKEPSIYSVSKLIDEKIILLRAEIKLKDNLLGIIGGLLLGMGIGKILARKKRKKQARIMRELISIVE